MTDHARDAEPSRPGGFRTASPWARALVVTSTVGAVALPALAGRTIPLPFAERHIVVLAVLVLSSAFNIEFGRWLEGRTTVEQRPHKALSLWAFATALTIPPYWVLPVVALTYAHAYWRGLRPEPWKMVGSATFVVIAAIASRAPLVLDSGVVTMQPSPSALFRVCLAILTFVVVESLLFFLISRVNHPEQEVWLRATLATPSFYLTEVSTLVVGALSVIVWQRLSWFGLLLLPVYALVQRAVLYEPLRTEAATDDKTGLLRYEAWRARAQRETARLVRAEQPWAILLVDLDHFKAFNDAHGHVAGDEAIAKAADTLRRTVRRCDLVGRFGGEEFVVMLSETDVHHAVEIAERMRRSIAEVDVLPMTASIGVAAVPGTEFGTTLQQALVKADRALYQAKAAGRDRVVTKSVLTATATS